MNNGTNELSKTLESFKKMTSEEYMELFNKMRCCGNCSKQGRKCKTISNFPVNFCGAWAGFNYD